MPARYLTMVQKEAVILHSDGNVIRFSGKSQKTIPIDLFRARTETAVISVRRGDEETKVAPEQTEYC